MTPKDKNNPFYGEEFVVTWFSDEEELLRATPLNGDELCSVEFNYNDVEKVK